MKPASHGAAKATKRRANRANFCAAISLLLVWDVSYALECPEDAIALTKEQTAVLLGSERPSSLTWKKFKGVDFSGYYGCNSAGAVAVSIYLGGWPPFSSDSSLPTVNGELGIYSITWQKKVRPDRVLVFETVFSLHSDYWKANVMIEAKDQNEFDKLVNEISRFPMFNAMPQPVGAP
jgi:hypothetical protein